MSTEIRILRHGDEAVLARVAADVFDDPIDPTVAEAFLRDPRHHLAVAVEEGVVVGFASALVYVHPDKPCPELWINEVGVAPERQARGIGKALLGALLKHARGLGCSKAWVLADASNEPARKLYTAMGSTTAPEPAVMFTFSLDGTRSA